MPISTISDDTPPRIEHGIGINCFINQNGDRSPISQQQQQQQQQQQEEEEEVINIPPPPALEEFAPLPPIDGNYIDKTKKVNNKCNHVLFEKLRDNNNIKNGYKKKKDKNDEFERIELCVDDEDCINVSDDEDDLPDLKVPNSSPSPSLKHKKFNHHQQHDVEDEDDDLILALPQ